MSPVGFTKVHFLLSTLSICIMGYSLPTQDSNQDYQGKQDSDRETTPYYKFPNPYCKHVGQFLPHPTNKCAYLRCDYGTEHWRAQVGGVSLFTLEQQCPPGTSVNRTTFYYAQYRLDHIAEEDFDPNDPYNFPVSPCTVPDPDCQLAIPVKKESSKEEGRHQHRPSKPRYEKSAVREQRYDDHQSPSDGYIRADDLPESPSNSY